MYIDGPRFEFDLTIKKYGVKSSDRGMYDPPPPRDEKPKEELLEKLTFNSRGAVEVIRKLLDYIREN